MTSQEFETDDEFAAEDAAFNEAHNIVCACTLSPDLPISEQVEEAADLMFDIAIRQGDKLMLACCVARFDDCIRAGKTPPRAMLEHINDAFHRWRSPGGPKSLDEAFGLKKPGPGAPPSWKQREEARTVVGLVTFYMKRYGLSAENAWALVEERFSGPAQPGTGRVRVDVGPYDNRKWRKYRRVAKPKK